MNDIDYRKLVASTYDDVEMPGGWKRNQVETLKTINRLYYSQFKNGKYDPQGFRKFFYNIVAPACDIATKFIDLDTRDILLDSIHPNDELRVFLMKRRLEQWLDDSDFGVTLNDITTDWPIGGHIVIKKSKDGWKSVPLHNLRNSPTAKGLVSDSFAEVYAMSLGEMEELGWNTEELRERGDVDEYIIYDFYIREGKGWKRCVKGDLWAKDRGNGLVRSVDSEINWRDQDYLGSTTLYEEDLKEHKYREIKWKNVPGMALGMGYVEYLEDNQVARNEVENLEGKALAVHSTPMWQTRDEEVAGKNTIVNYQPGQLIYTQSEITPVATEARNLPQFQSRRQNIDSNSERKTFTSDITTGASLPSRTPLGVANLQATLASSFFERKREELGLFIKRLLIDDIIPSFKNDTASEHTMIFSCADPEADYVDRAIVDALVGQEMKKYTDKHGWFPSKEQKELLKLRVQDQLKGKKNRYFKIPDGFWGDAKYIVKINITGESTDVSVKSQVLQLALQILGTNPAITQNPGTRQIFFKFLTMGGINPAEIGLTYQVDPQQMQPQVAGSLSAPSPVQGGMASQMQV